MNNNNENIGVKEARILIKTVSVLAKGHSFTYFEFQLIALICNNCILRLEQEDADE